MQFGLLRHDCLVVLNKKKQWLRKVPKSVCVGGGGGEGGGGTQTRNLCPSEKNQYKGVVFGYMVIY